MLYGAIANFLKLAFKRAMKNRKAVFFWICVIEHVKLVDVGSRKQYPVLSSGLNCSELIFQLPKTILDSLMDNTYLQVIVQDLLPQIEREKKTHQKEINVRIEGKIMTLNSRSTWNTDTITILSTKVHLGLVNRS